MKLCIVYYNRVLHAHNDFWLAWKMWVYVKISVGPAGRMIVRCGKNLNVATFLDTINVINVKFYMMVLLPGLYLSTPLSVTMTIFQGHRSVNSSNWNFDVLTWVGWNFIVLLSTPSRWGIYYLFWQSHKFEGGNWHISSFTKKKKKKNYIGFFLDTMKASPHFLQFLTLMWVTWA